MLRIRFFKSFLNIYKMRNLRVCIFMIVSICCATACKDEAAHKAAVDTAIAEKIERYKQKRVSDCMQSCLVEASKKSDSIMILNADIWQWDDSIRRPQKMERPEKPNFKRLDSVAIKPLFDKKG
jgi:hypothetical protein